MVMTDTRAEKIGLRILRSGDPRAHLVYGEATSLDEREHVLRV